MDKDLIFASVLFMLTILKSTFLQDWLIPYLISNP